MERQLGFAVSQTAPQTWRARKQISTLAFPLQSTIQPAVLTALSRPSLRNLGTADRTFTVLSMDVVKSRSPLGEKKADETDNSWFTVCSGLGEDLFMFLRGACR
jgi:hypothetical protein